MCPDLPFIHFSGRFVLQPNGVISYLVGGLWAWFQEKLLKIQVGPGGTPGSESAIYFLNRHKKMIEDDLKIYWIDKIIQSTFDTDQMVVEDFLLQQEDDHLIIRYTLHDTNGSHLKRDGWKTTFLPFWISAYFQVRIVSCREGKNSRVKISLPEKNMQSH